MHLVLREGAEPTNCVANGDRDQPLRIEGASLKKGHSRQPRTPFDAWKSC